jgi:FixJ family two-component response regulator
MSLNEMVYVLEDDAGVRKSLAWMLESNKLAASTYASPSAFLQDATVDCPSCLILDVNLPGMSGIEVLRELGKRPELTMPVLILTGAGNIAAAVECMKLGATDFLEKPIEHALLLAKVRASLTSDSQRRKQAEDWAHSKRRLERLTEREREILTLLCDGKSSKQMAAQLKISTKTVSIHRWHLMKKMQVASATEAIRVAHDAKAA